MATVEKSTVAILFVLLKTLCGGSSKIWAGLYNGTTTELAKQTEVNSLKTSVSSGKAQIASAITGKGVSTSSSASFSTMATNIGKINTRTEIDTTIIAAGRWVSTFYANRTTSSYDSVSGYVVDSMSGETLTTYKYNDTSTLICFRKGRNAGVSKVFDVMCPTATLNPDTLTLTFSVQCKMNTSWDCTSGATWRCTITNITTSPLVVTCRVPSNSYRVSSGYYSLTCSNLIVTAAFNVNTLAWSLGGETITLPITAFNIKW